jgi:hypothetical protein
MAVGFAQALAKRWLSWALRGEMLCNVAKRLLQLR